jgi:hypothetical protein
VVAADAGGGEARRPRPRRPAKARRNPIAARFTGSRYRRIAGLLAATAIRSLTRQFPPVMAMRTIKNTVNRRTIPTTIRTPIPSHLSTFSAAEAI